MIIYEITNNNKSYIGKTNEKNIYRRINDHKTLLEEEKHYIPLLQQEYDEKNFKYKTLYESNNKEKIISFFANTVRNKKTNTPSFGYNFEFDDKISTNNSYKYHISDEDIIFMYIKGNTITQISKKYNMAYQAIEYRLKRNNIKTNKQEKKKISTYNQFNKIAETYLLLTDEQDISSQQIINQVEKNYNISSKLQISSKKLSKNLQIKGYKYKKTNPLLFQKTKNTVSD